MGTVIWILIKYGVALLLLLAMIATIFVFTAPTFGAKPSDDSLARIHQSANFDGAKFLNSIPTAVGTPSSEKSFSIWEFLRPPAGKNPVKPLPTRRFDAATFKDGDFVWYGHSTVLFRTDGINVLTDPVFNKASPVPFTVRPFKMTEENPIESLPDIDLVLISHDHYDHLDHKAIGFLRSKVERFLVPLGIKAHLMHWGVAEYKIEEFDWYETTQHSSLALTFAPSRHFSGRGFTDRSSTLWGSWIIKSKGQNVYFSGDSGYYEEFKKIGESHGPFDIAFVENGAYDVNWSQIHLMPEEAVQASIDLKANVFVPIHWGKFDLAAHQWSEPVVRAKVAASQHQINLATPRIGEVFSADKYPVDEWWIE